jgi:hypothetical protein
MKGARVAVRWPLLPLVWRRHAATATATYVDRPFVTSLAAIKADEVRPMYRVMDRAGKIVSDEAPHLSKETCVKMYTVS